MVHAKLATKAVLHSIRFSYLWATDRSKLQSATWALSKT